MVILGKTEFGHMETGGMEKHLISGQPGEKNSVAVMLDFKNDSWKTIQTIIFSCLPYNALDCIVSSTERKPEEAQLRFMGVIQPNEIKRHVYWENVWYSPEIVLVKLIRINITYTDGSMESLSDRQIQFECA